LNFRVLGPLEIVESGQPVSLNGAKQRALLALLLLNAGRVVSSDRLLDELWGENPPDSGTAALQVRVSQLRKALGKGGKCIKTRPPGYTIDLGPGQLDLHTFERLLDQAKELTPADASSVLEEALDLWRGPALDDFTYEPFAQAAIARLEEMRLAATELRIEANLALGRHLTLVPELEDLVRSHPLRERLRAQLMLALYRSQRQADALELYQVTRRALLDGLGIEPSTGLQRLEAAILRQDADLELASGAPVQPRSIMVALWPDSVAESLLSLAVPLAQRPERELIVVQITPSTDDLPDRSRALKAHRDALLADGIDARAAAFASATPADDVLQLAHEQDVDLLLVGAPPDLLDDDPLRRILVAAQCDVGIVVRGNLREGSVLVPFTGADHDWSAVELAAWIAAVQDRPLQLAGPVAPADRTKRDSSRLLASASLAVQRALGVCAEPLLLEPGEAALLEAAGRCALLVVGLSERWRMEGIGAVRGALATGALVPMVLVRRGIRPGGLAPRERLSRFTWTLGSSV
jgi:DNA-binding SARP family transcriptional activator